MGLYNLATVFFTLLPGGLRILEQWLPPLIDWPMCGFCWFLGVFQDWVRVFTLQRHPLASRWPVLTVHLLQVLLEVPSRTG